MMSMEMEDVAGSSRSLMNNLTASAMGCNRPYGPTIFWPFAYNLKFFVQLVLGVLWLKE